MQVRILPRAWLRRKRLGGGSSPWTRSALPSRGPTRIIQINTGFTGSFSLLLSNNASTGGTCFGDSGGPNYVGTSNVIAGVTSFALNRTCGGTGGVFRLDRQDVLDFVTPFLK